jgi:hypothetical protein
VGVDAGLDATGAAAVLLTVGNMTAEVVELIAETVIYGFFSYDLIGKCRWRR